MAATNSNVCCLVALRPLIISLYNEFSILKNKMLMGDLKTYPVLFNIYQCSHNYDPVFHIWMCQNTSLSLVPLPVSEFPSGFKFKWNLFPSDNFLPFADIMGIIQQRPVFLRNNPWTPTVRQRSPVNRTTPLYELTKLLFQVTNAFWSASVCRSPAVNTNASKQF